MCFRILNHLRGEEKYDRVSNFLIFVFPISIIVSLIFSTSFLINYNGSLRKMLYVRDKFYQVNILRANILRDVDNFVSIGIISMGKYKCASKIKCVNHFEFLSKTGEEKKTDANATSAKRNNIVNQVLSAIIGTKLSVFPSREISH